MAQIVTSGFDASKSGRPDAQTHSVFCLEFLSGMTFEVLFIRRTTDIGYPITGGDGRKWERAWQSPEWKSRNGVLPWTAAGRPSWRLLKFVGEPRPVCPPGEARVQVWACAGVGVHTTQGSSHACGPGGRVCAWSWQWSCCRVRCRSPWSVLLFQTKKNHELQRRTHSCQNGVVHLAGKRHVTPRSWQICLVTLG